MRGFLVLSCVCLALASIGEQGVSTEKQQNTCGNFVCPETDLCCNDVRLGLLCYNPSTHHCKSNVLCALADEPCMDSIRGALCIDATRYRCGGGILVCAYGDDACDADDQGPVCFDRETEHCPNGLKVCDKAELACDDDVIGPVCYNPDTHHCINGVKLCALDEGVCNGVCFKSREYFCMNNILYYNTQLGTTITLTPETSPTTTMETTAQAIQATSNVQQPVQQPVQTVISDEKPIGVQVPMKSSSYKLQSVSSPTIMPLGSTQGQGIATVPGVPTTTMIGNQQATNWYTTDQPISVSTESQTIDQILAMQPGYLQQYMAAQYSNNPLGQQQFLADLVDEMSD